MLMLRSFGLCLIRQSPKDRSITTIRHCWQFVCKIIFARSNEIVIRSYKESSNNWQFNKFVPFPHVFHGVFQCIHDVEVLTAFLLKRIVDISSERMIVRVLKPRKKTSDRSIWDFFFQISHSSLDLIIFFFSL